MKTPLGQVRGLGSARSGTDHFIAQRLTAIASLPLLAFAVVVVVSLAGDPHAEVVAVLSRPWIAVLLLAAVIAVAWHMKLGVQIVIEDYVHGEGWKLTLLIANIFFTALVAIACAVALLTIAFGG